MNPTQTSFRPAASAPAVAICLAAMLSLSLAMGVGRFAFTPLFPLMVRDGLLDGEAGAVLAGSNYLGYLLGALLVARLRVSAARLLAAGLVGTVVVTAAVGWSGSLPVWALLRCVAGVLSAWTLVATSAWGLGWLAQLGRPHLAGAIFAGVGLGITAAGLFCLFAAQPGVRATQLWVELAGLAALAGLLPVAVSLRLPLPPAAPASPAMAPVAEPPPARASAGLVVCYSLFGFGYILPATYLPALARQLADDPRIFGLAWPLFGAAAALSTVFVAWRLRHADRLRVWAASHLLMALGVLLPVLWASLAGIAIAALLVGGTFMVITMVAMQEGRARGGSQATAVLARMTAGFAFGQLMGPLVSALLGRFTADFAGALDAALLLSAAGLVASAIYLGRRPARLA